MSSVMHDVTDERWFVTIMTNVPSGTLSIGVKAYLPARVARHRSGTGSEFCRKHGLKRLVYIEHHDDIASAIAREKAMKAWRRMEARLIGRANPDWLDLYLTFAA